MPASSSGLTSTATHVVAVREVAQRGRQVGGDARDEDDLQVLEIHQLPQNQAGKSVEQVRVVDEQQGGSTRGERRGDRLAGPGEQQTVLGRSLGAGEEWAQRGEGHFVR